ncbi:MAG: hypothetical protein KDJ36_07555, partial [Hyphomicrobiaceae bacterium]|nr:hypothetical protein [Hyphomicrobiaceae bacterium]
MYLVLGPGQHQSDNGVIVSANSRNGLTRHLLAGKIFTPLSAVVPHAFENMPDSNKRRSAIKVLGP